MEVALITEKLFKENSPITTDTVITEFVPYVLIAQMLKIKKILGLPLYEELQTQIKAASVTPAPEVNPITPANRALILKIAPALSFYAVYQGLPFHWASILNKGVTLRDSENSKAVDIKDIAQLRKWIKDDAEVLAADLVGYLNGCTDYPLYIPEQGYCGEDSKTVGARVDVDFGIFIPNRRK